MSNMLLLVNGPLKMYCPGSRHQDRINHVRTLLEEIPKKENGETEVAGRVVKSDTNLNPSEGDREGRLWKYPGLPWSLRKIQQGHREVLELKTFQGITLCYQYKPQSKHSDEFQSTAAGLLNDFTPSLEICEVWFYGTNLAFHTLWLKSKIL